MEGLQPTFAYQITALLLLSTLYEPLRKQLISVLGVVGGYNLYAYLANPLTGVIEGLRAVLVFGREPDWGVVGISATLIVMLFVASLILFKKTDKYFADVI